jgi:hypothetical protein
MGVCACPCARVQETKACASREEGTKDLISAVPFFSFLFLLKPNTRRSNKMKNR